jgi:DNA-binding response OmpR family regulator
MRTYSILIVDDSPDVVSYLSAFFKNNHFNVEVADNGEDALTVYKTFHPDIIIMDVEMPEKNGWEVLRIIRKENKRIPIGIMSDIRKEAPDAVKSYEDGADFFVCKPFNLTTDYAKVNRLLKITYGEDAIITFDDFELDKSLFRLTTKSGTFKLTEREAHMLYLLAQNCNQVVDAQDLLNIIGGLTLNSHNIKIINNFVSKLRKQLRNNANIKINSFYGKGYSFVYTR